MGDFTNKMKYDEFKDRAHDKGWLVNDTDEKRLKLLYEFARTNPEVDKLLEKMTKTEGWYEGDREAMFEEVRQKLVEDPNTDQNLFLEFSNYYLNDVSQDELDKRFKEIYVRERPLTKAEQIKLHREKQKQIEDEIKQHMEDFDKKYNMTEDEFINHVLDNNWGYDNQGYQNDVTGFRRLYRATKHSMDPDLLSVFNDVLYIEVNDVITRNKLAKRVSDAMGLAIGRGVIHGDDKEALEETMQHVVIHDHLSAKNFEVLKEKCEERRENLRIEKQYKDNVPKFLKKMHDLGWARYDDESLKSFYKAYNKTVDDGESPIDSAMIILLNSKVDKNYPASSKSQILTQFIDKLNKMDDLKVDAETKHALKLPLNGLALNYSGEYIKESNAKIAKDNAILQKNKEAAKKIFLDQMKANGWSDDELGKLGKIFDYSFDNKTGYKGFEPAINMLLDAKVARGTKYQEAVSKTTIMNTFIDYVKHTDEGLKGHVVEEAKGIAKSYNKVIEQKKFDDVKKSIEEAKPKAEDAKKINTDDMFDLKASVKISQNKKNSDELLEQIRREAVDFYNTIKKVDFMLFGKGSPEFNRMLAGLKELKEYAQESFYIKDDGNINARSLAEYYDKQQECIESVKEYISHKQTDLQAAGRKNSAWRQLHEQPRINASLNVLEKLGASYSRGRNVIITSMRELHRPELEKHLEEQGKRRSDDDVLFDGFKSSIIKSTDMIKNLDGRNWSPRGGAKPEKLEDFVVRIENYSNKITYENSIYDALYNPDGVTNRTFLKVDAIWSDLPYEGPKYPSSKIVNNEQLRAIYNEYAPKKFTNKMKEYDVNAEIKEIKDGVKTLKGQMLSTSQQRKNEAAERAANAPGR